MSESVLPEPHPVESGTLRLFFALWPDDATRDALNRTGKWLHQHWGGRRMRADTLHLTLAFLGNTPADRMDTLDACVGTIRPAAFDLILDQTGYWRHNRIGWLGVSQTPSAHLELVGALTAVLQGAGFPVDARPHVPHVTLLRNTAGGDVPVCVPVRWQANDFVLVKSVTGYDGARYEVIRRWPLSLNQN